ncbi:hypothetical protein [Xanthocytophaga flava]|uniref:hypothetical protein n=1 Tax=Xanthocytophaga flava TaxID=3048013 RepID=UPI0028D882B2|nr:hypothetical protein [Xanthocytophaga flavus]
MDTTSLLLILLVCGLPFLIYIQYQNLRKLIQEGVRLEKELHAVIKKNACNKEISLDKDDLNKIE